MTLEAGSNRRGVRPAWLTVVLTYLGAPLLAPARRARVRDQVRVDVLRVWARLYPRDRVPCWPLVPNDARRERAVPPSSPDRRRASGEACPGLSYRTLRSGNTGAAPPPGLAPSKTRDGERNPIQPNPP